MVIGPFINASAVLLGGVLGALLSQRLPERIRVSMTSIFLVWHRWGLVFYWW
ncbi:Putative inner membrane protein YqgA [Escherichia coli ISC41]|nr:Putative inner membrane protein YqgA [Escherichia coli ISC41]